MPPAPRRQAERQTPPPRIVHSALDQRALLLSLPGLSAPTGTLTALELQRFEFTAVRFFVVHARAGATRGAHAHRQGRQLLVRTAGRISVELKLAGHTATFELNAHHNACLIEAPVWSTQTFRGQSPALLVLCDTPYDPEDYIEVNP